MLITRLLPKKNAGKLIVCNLILIFLFSYFSFSVFADNPTDEPVVASTEKTTAAATEIFTENVTEMETESSTETLKSINDSISVKDLLLIIAVMLLLLIVIAVIRFIL